MLKLPTTAEQGEVWVEAGHVVAVSQHPTDSGRSMVFMGGGMSFQCRLPAGVVRKLVEAEGDEEEALRRGE